MSSAYFMSPPFEEWWLVGSVLDGESRNCAGERRALAPREPGEDAEAGQRRSHEQRRAEAVHERLRRRVDAVAGEDGREDGDAEDASELAQRAVRAGRD